MRTKKINSYTYQRRVERRTVDADAGVRVLVSGRVRGSIDADCRTRQPGVRREGEPGAVVLTGADRLPGDWVGDDWPGRVAAGGGGRAGVAVAAGGECAAGDAGPARRERRRGARAAVWRGGRAAGPRPAVAHEQLQEKDNFSTSLRGYNHHWLIQCWSKRLH